MFKVSIEIPTNRLNYIDDCLRSVFEQTDPNWVVDVAYNGQRSEFDYLKSKYKSEKVNLHFIEGKKEIYELRQFLTQNSQGEVSFPLDSDDLLLPEAVSEIRESFQAYPNIGFVIGYSVLIKENKEIVKIEEMDKYPEYVFLKEKIFVNNIEVCPLGKVQPYIFKKDIFREKIKSWKAYPAERFKAIGEEIDLFIKFALISDMLFITKPLYLYRDHGNNIFKKWGKEEISRATLNMMKELTDEYKRSKYSQNFPAGGLLTKSLINKIVNESIKIVKGKEGFKVKSTSQEIFPSS